MIDSLRSILLPLQQYTLIVPYSVVAEVVPYDKVNPIPNAPQWLLGKYQWRGLDIPMVSIEQMSNGNPMNIDKDNALSLHVAIFNRIFKNTTFQFLGILLQGIPRMSRCKRSDVKFVSTPEKPFLEMEVSLREQTVFIPNIQWIEEKVIELEDR